MHLHMRSCRRVLWPSAALLLATALAGCGGGSYQAQGVQTESGEITQPGIYASDNGEMIRLSGTPSWERRTWEDRNDLSPDTVLFVHDPKIQSSAVTSDHVLLREVAWIKQDIVAQTGAPSVASDGPWVTTDLEEFRHPASVSAVGPNTLRVTPHRPLPPGLYSIGLAGGGDTLARFAVGWSEADMFAYARSHCVDRYKSGDVAVYTRCETEIGSATVTIRDLRAERVVDTSTSALVVTGKLENVGGNPARVPPLVASAVDTGGGTLDQWTFSTNPSYLMPGETTSFETRFNDAPKSVRKVEIRIPDAETQ